MNEAARIREHYDRSAGGYDRSIGIFEKLLFGGGRAWVCSQAFGEVLEIAAGTGRNFPFYSAGARITATDISPAMLDIARRRAKELGIEADLKPGDAENLEFGD